MLTASKVITLEEFLEQYADSPQYELADGELVDMEPTGYHETVSGKLAAYIGTMLLQSKQSWFMPRSCLIRPFSEIATARRPDLIVLDESILSNEPLWHKEPIITQGKSIKLAVEVVSTNWETDYARKVEEYAFLSIPEYWIVDYRGLGGVAFIGKPKQPTFTVCELMGEEYQQTQYRLKSNIFSPLFPNLQLCLEDILPRF
jgi:Uma2 family endonuclease